MKYQSVVFDLGGVVMESPLHAINRFERAHGLSEGAITSLVGAAGEQSAWTALETGKMSKQEFVPVFTDELAAGGLEVPVAELLTTIEADTVPRPAMLTAIDRLRAAGLTVAALTNNWVPFPSVDESDLRSRFDVFVESFREGVNKPNPEIYRRLLSRLGVPADRIVYLDDIGRNLKPGAELGMTTIMVDDPVAALVELGRLVGLQLV